MAIQRKQYGGAPQGKSKNIRTPGEYVVRVADAKVTMTKSKIGKDGKPTKPRRMRVLTFETLDGQELRINSYHVEELDFQMEAYKDCAVACGCSPESRADELLDKRCGIAVEAQKPTEDGKVFMQIVGYGRASDVEQKQQRANDDFHHHEEPSQDHDDPFGPPPDFQ